MYMVPSVVKESSGLYTINNRLYIKVQKADKDSKFHCVVEYMMPSSAAQQKSSQPFSLNLHCEYQPPRLGTLSFLTCITFTFTFSHLADTFVQSDVQGREQSS